MSASFINYVSAASFPGLPYRFLHRSAQASDSETMRELLEEIFAEVNAINAGIVAPGDKLGIADMDLAGAGDGHTFVVLLTFLPVQFITLGAVQGYDVSTVEPIVTVAGTGAECAVLLDTEIGATLAAAPQSPGLICSFQMMRGAAKGTRFMAVALPVPAPQG